MAHRGLPWNFPENSIASFEEALKNGADIIEFDIRMTKDRELIIMHDETLDRTTNGAGLIKDYNLSELKDFSVIYTKSGTPCKGEPIPTLMDLVNLVRSRTELILNCEFKESSKEQISLTIDLFKEEGLLKRTVFTCFDYEVLTFIKDYEPASKVQGFPLELMRNVDGRDKDPDLLFDYVGIKKSLASAELIDAYRKKGIIPGIWVLNSYEEYKEALEMGASIITTDRIDLLNSYLTSGE